MRLSTLFEPNFSAAVAIVADGNKLLLGKSTSNDSRSGKWCFPGGGIKHNEPPEKAAERECFEETGIQCKTVKGAAPHKSKPGVAFVVCQKTGGELKPNHEFSELDWIQSDQLSALPDFYQPNLQILQDIEL